nr:ATP-binding protein [uncultured Methanoregula sp.]
MRLINIPDMDLSDEIAVLRRAEAISRTGSWDYDRETGAFRISEETARILGMAWVQDGRILQRVGVASVPGWDHIRTALLDLSEPGREFNILFGIELPGTEGRRMVNAAGTLVPVAEEGRSYISGIVKEVPLSGLFMSDLPNQFNLIMNTTGLESLDGTCEMISAWLDADCVMIGRILPGGESVKVISMRLDGKKVSDHTYKLKDTPCENVAAKGFCLYPEHAFELFPKSQDLKTLGIQGYLGTPLRNNAGDTIGVICVLSRRPLHPEPIVRICIELIALKAGAEIERHLAEEALENNRLILADALNLAHIASWEYDAATGLFQFDQHFYSLFATTTEQEGGSCMPAEVFSREFIHPDDRISFTTDLKKIVADTAGTNTAMFEHRVIRRDAEIRDMMVRVCVIRNAAGKILQVHGSDQDITELKKAERALVQANRKINLLGSVTRHDILNQVTILRSYFRHTKKKHPEPAIGDCMDKLDTIAQKIQHQIEFTRIYKDLGCNTPGWFELNEIMPEIPGTIRFSSDLQNLSAYADPIIEKVFENLLDNSLRYGKHVSEIKVSVTPHNGAMMVLWEDNGIGIPAEEKELIFEHGYGVNTGLGLFLAREILAITGISIRETGTPGKGARFEMILPEGTYR